MVANSSPSHLPGDLCVPNLSTAEHFCASGHRPNPNDPRAAPVTGLVCGTTADATEQASGDEARRAYETCPTSTKAISYSIHRLPQIRRKSASHAVTGGDRLTERHERLNIIQEVPNEEASSANRSHSPLLSETNEGGSREEYFDAATNSSPDSNVGSAQSTRNQINTSTNDLRGQSSLPIPTIPDMVPNTGLRIGMTSPEPLRNTTQVEIGPISIGAQSNYSSVTGRFCKYCV